MQINIKGYAFMLQEPYAQGHVLSHAEAKALNVLRGENIRNNVTRMVSQAEMAIGAGHVLGMQDRLALQERITNYDMVYEFRSHVRRDAGMTMALRHIAGERLARVYGVAGWAALPDFEQDRLMELEMESPDCITQAEQWMQQQIAVQGFVGA